MFSKTKSITLAIGDGANDVSSKFHVFLKMTLFKIYNSFFFKVIQEAHVGIGIIYMSKIRWCILLYCYKYYYIDTYCDIVLLLAYCYIVILLLHCYIYYYDNIYYYIVIYIITLLYIVISYYYD